MKEPTFAEFFHEVHKYPPYPWQARLADAAREDEWPDLIDVPTGAGKTAVLDAAVFALATRHMDAPRRAPLRTFLVVDRRLIVDQAAEHASTIARALIEASSGTACGYVADRLRKFGGAVPLAVRTMRGGMFEDTRYVDPLNQPLLCLGTVDQIGSRLLFRGYGVGARFRSMHAAMTGTDALIVLDEAHLSQAFLATLRQVVRYQQCNAGAVPSLRIVQMSATSGVGPSMQRLGLSEVDQSVLAPILNAAKPAALIEAEDVEATAAQQASALAVLGAKVIGVVVNRVASARDIFERLRVLPSAEAILLTGQTRPWDRDQLLQRYLERIRAGRQGIATNPLYVVATQTIEVGADLDFDALVTEAAPLSALRQRFGRLNRRGPRESVGARVILRKTDKGDDPIYGPAVAATWKWLKTHAKKRKKVLEVDFGIAALDAFLPGPPDLAPPYRDAPVLLPAYLDSWLQTLPAPDPDPVVAPFLHGTAEPSGDVAVVWRADLGSVEKWWPEIITLQPPLVREGLPLSLNAARAWLAGGEAMPTGDLEAPETREDVETRAERPFLLWRDSPEVTRDPSAIRPGDTIVVPSSYGGCDAFGWTPRNAEPVLDLGDLVAAELGLAGKRRLCVRVHSRLLGTAEAMAGLLDKQNAGFRELATMERHELWVWLSEILQLMAAAPLSVPMPAAAKTLLELGRTKCMVITYPDANGCAVRAISALKVNESARSFLDLSLCVPAEPDDESLTLSNGDVTLPQHCRGVAKWVGRLASACNLPANLQQDLQAAAMAHDAGKCDPRFQMVLGSVSPTGNDASRLLAKGRVCSVAEQKRRYRLAGYPNGARHEVDSVSMLENSSTMTEVQDPELVLHLVGSHHGYGRSLPPVWVGGEAETLSYASLSGASGPPPAGKQYEWAERFWSLNGRYGPWQLAYLETILRQADWARSEEEAAACQT